MIYEDLEGWLSDAEAAELQRLAHGLRVLEVGTWKGRSAVLMLLAGATHVISVDHFTGDGYTGKVCPVETLRQLRDNLNRYGVADRVTQVIGRFESVTQDLRCDSCGLLFYDADHTEQATRDALGWFESDGHSRAVWAVHDYDKHHERYAGVVRVVDEFARRTGRQVRVVDRLAILERLTFEVFPLV